MILTFHVPPPARVEGVYDIDSLYLELNSPEKLKKKISKKWEVLVRRNKTDYKANGKTRSYFAVSGLPNFFDIFSEFFWTINYRYPIVPAWKMHPTVFL